MDNPTAPQGPAPTRRREVAGNAAMLLGLWGLAVAQPLLDLYGKNGELFVAAHQPPMAIVAFALVVTLAVPALLAVLEVVAYALSQRAGAILHSAFVLFLGVALAAGLLGRLDIGSTVAAVVLPILLGGAVLYGSRRFPAVATALRYLAFGPVLFLVSFLFFSRSSRLVFDHAAAAEGATSIGRPAPVVVLQLDEFPLASLLREDMAVNEQRFPNFAALADQSTWYRDATSVASQTSLSVPSVVTGLMPDVDALPTAADHPRSLFTLLNGRYSMNVQEEVTSLCPPSACGDDNAPREPFGSLLLDASVVYGHVALAPAFRSHLPRVDQAWAGFVEGVEPVEAPSASGTPNSSATPSLPFGSDWADLEAFRAGPAGQGGDLQRVIRSIGTTAEPSLTYAHVLLPHGPWLMVPSGQQHSGYSPMFGLTTGGTWRDDVAARQGLQRHLLQVGYTDTLLGQFMERLRSTGLWDDALIVVVADHGAAFTPGRSVRVPADDTLHEIYNVPLFVKYPGQTAGAVVTSNALLTDVLPTIVDALDIETDWHFDGRSLLDDAPRDPAKPVAEDEVPDGVPDGMEGVEAVVRRNRAYLLYGQDWRGVAQVAPYGDLVGQSLDTLTVGDPSPMTWTGFRGVDPFNPDGPESRVLQVGQLHLAGGAPPTAGLLAVNGTVAGVAVGFGVDGDDAEFSGIITPEFFVFGSNDLQLLLPDEDGGRVFHVVTPIDR